MYGGDDQAKPFYAQNWLNGISAGLSLVLWLLYMKYWRINLKPKSIRHSPRPEQNVIVAKQISDEQEEEMKEDKMQMQQEEDKMQLLQDDLQEEDPQPQPTIVESNFSKQSESSYIAPMTRQNKNDLTFYQDKDLVDPMTPLQAPM